MEIYEKDLYEKNENINFFPKKYIILAQSKTMRFEIL